MVDSLTQLPCAHSARILHLCLKCGARFEPDETDSELSGLVWRNLSSMTSGFTGHMPVAVKAFNMRFSVNVDTQAGQNRAKKSPLDSGERP